MDSDLNIEQLLKEYLQPLRACLASLGVHTDLIDDLAQDVFLAVIRNWQNYDRSRPFRSWLFGIARNLAHQEFRKRGVASRIRQGLVTEMLIEHSTRFSTEEDNALATDTAVEVARNCVEKLPDHARQLVNLRFRDGKRCDEIAGMLRRKGSSIRMALMRIRDTLRQCVEAGIKEAAQ